MNVLFATRHGPASPGARYRVFQHLPRLQAFGIRPTVLVMQDARSTERSLGSVHLSGSRGLAHNARLWLDSQRFVASILRAAGRFDRIFLYRILVPGWAVPSFGRHRDRLIFDFDDALDQPESDGSLLQRLRAGQLSKGLSNAIRASSFIITSNRRNADVVSALGGRVAIVPTAIDLSLAVLRDRSSFGERLPVLGWIGTPSTARYLPAIENALHRVRERHPTVVRLVGAGRSPFRAFDSDLRPWSLQTEYSEVAGFDVGLMPMPDTPWTSGKAALKALQYGACGAPTVASRTDTNVEILAQDEGVLFCRDENEWVGALNRLLEDCTFRADIGRRARTRVERCYSLEAWTPRLFELIANGPEHSR